MSRQVASLLAFAIALAACVTNEPPDASSTSSSTAVTQPGQTTTSTVPSTDTTATTSPPETRTITVLVDDVRAVALSGPAAAFTEREGIEVVFEVAPLDEIRARAGEPGVDIFMGPHTWLAELEEREAILDSAVDTGLWSEPARLAFERASTMMAVPFSAEALVLYRNTDLWPDLMSDFRDGCGDVPACLLMPGLGTAGGYHFSPFAMAGSTAPLPDGLAADAGRPALLTFERLVDSGDLRLESTVASRQAFLAGGIPLFVGGPWDLGPIEDSGLAFAVQPLPPARGVRLRAPTSVLGFYLSAAASEPEAARLFLGVLASAETQLELHARDRRSPVRQDALAAAPPPIDAFAAAVGAGFLLPMGDATRVWAELGEAVDDIRAGMAAEAALASAVDAIRAGQG